MFFWPYARRSGGLLIADCIASPAPAATDCGIAGKGQGSQAKRAIFLLVHNVRLVARVVCKIRATNVGILRQSEKRREDPLTASRAPSSVVHHQSNRTRLAQGRAPGEHTAPRFERSRDSSKVEACDHPHLLAFTSRHEFSLSQAQGFRTSQNVSDWG